MLAMISIFLTYQKLPDFFGNPNVSDTTQENDERSYLDVRII